MSALRILSIVGACGLAFVAATADARSQGACARGDAAVAGHYYLNGVMEVGSELLLRPDGSFEFYLAYGANDQYGKGCWKQTGRSIALVPAGKAAVSGRHTPETMGFLGFNVTVDGRDLVWDIGGSGKKGRYER